METVRCKTALSLAKECTSTDSLCTAHDYYSALQRAGFALPPFYEVGYVPK